MEKSSEKQFSSTTTTNPLGPYPLLDCSGKETDERWILRSCQVSLSVRPKFEGRPFRFQVEIKLKSGNNEGTHFHVAPAAPTFFISAARNQVVQVPPPP